MLNKKQRTLFCTLLFVGSMLSPLVGFAKATRMDDYEPNDTFTDAIRLYADSPDSHGYFEDLTQGDEDYWVIWQDFSTDADPMDGEVIIRFDHTENDMRLEVYDENEILIMESDTDLNEESVIFEMECYKRYYVVIKGENNGAAYQLYYDVARSEAVPDEFENRNDDLDDWFTVNRVVLNPNT